MTNEMTRDEIIEMIRVFSGHIFPVERRHWEIELNAYDQAKGK